MPFTAIAREDFVNRDRELEHLRQTAEFSDSAMADCILLEGARGIGKTELLRQLYGILFRESKNVVPFYYTFQPAALKAATLARDYLASFLRQYLAFARKDTAVAENVSIPLTRLLPLAAELGFDWLVDLVADCTELQQNAAPDESLRAAIAAPRLAAAAGLPVLVILDDFQLAARIYEAEPQDGGHLAGLFAQQMQRGLTPHILSGSPEGVLETILSEESFRGKAERMPLQPLPEDEAFRLFQTCCNRLKLTVRDDLRPHLKILGGSPLYLRSLAWGLWRMQKQTVAARDFWECYGHEVTEGQIAFYWSSVLSRQLKDLPARGMLLRVLMQAIDSGPRSGDLQRTAAILGLSPAALESTLRSLQAQGILRESAACGTIQDPLLEDFVKGLFWAEIEGRDLDSVRSLIQSGRAEHPDTGFFAMTIPMEADAELVAARAMEQICTNISLDSEIIAQLQLALIEACINAKEHSGSHDRKMTLRFNVQPERIEIAVESPGKAFGAESGGNPDIDQKLHSNHKRGWGMKLMRELMDEVRVETIGNRTRVVLVKNIPQESVLEQL